MAKPTRKFVIAIPCVRGPETVRAVKAVEKPLLCVPSCEASEFRKLNLQACGIVEYGDERLDLHEARNWIAKHWRQSDVWILDPDVVSVRRRWLRPVRKIKRVAAVPVKLSRKTATEAAQATISTGEACGTYLCGWYAAGSRGAYAPQAPFRLTGQVGLDSFGLGRGHGLRFDSRVGSYGSQWLSLLNAHRHRTCFVDERFTVEIKRPPAVKLDDADVVESIRFMREHFGSRADPRRTSDRIGVKLPY